MSFLVDRIVDNLEPGDVVDVNHFENTHGPALKRELLGELEGRGYVLDSRGVVGEVEICSACEGDGAVRGKGCGMCDGNGTTIDSGRGKKAFHG